jgi:DNA (cytosine-5)-methyltransferase 1
VVYIERDAYAAACLVARMEEKRLAQGPVWDDLCTFDGRPWSGLVDLVAGGTPCPEFSLANPQRKQSPEEQLSTERGSLFHHHLRIAVECEAPLFFWENVAGAAGAVPLIATAIHAANYSRIVWTVLRASEVEAPHERARIFLLAHSESFGQREPHHQGRPEPRQRTRGDASGSGVRLDAKESLGHSRRQGLEGRGSLAGDAGTEQPSAERAGTRVDTRVPLLGRDVDPSVANRVVSAHGCASASGTPRLGPYPPSRLGIEQWARVLEVRPDLAPALPQPRVRRGHDGMGHRMDPVIRSDRLRLTGNGVVRAQAEHAWRGLWSHLFKE